MIVFLFSCSVVEKHRLDFKYGTPEVSNRLPGTLAVDNTDDFDTSAEVKSAVNYSQDIKPILDRRCVVCHGCYDAPCQLKLSSTEGLERGASKDKVYDPTRLTAAKPSRLFEDDQTVEQWRTRYFFPVLNERKQNPGANLDGSVMAKLLMLKQEHPLPNETPLPESFDFSLDNAKNCSTIEEFPRFAQKNPLWGMPYGLPQLPQQEYQTLIQWLAEGANYQTDHAISVENQQQIKHWEQFLNADSLKHQLMSRYIYEHLFIARLYFASSSENNFAQQPDFYRMVRSKTPPGEKVERISRRRPYDDPGVDRVYYRIIPDTVTTLAKTHMPYRLDSLRIKRYHELFIAPDYQVEQLPGYELKNSSNPFITFVDLPIRSRYKFMLDEAEFTIMAFIKGPVCRGQVALNVIQDHFWVFFLNPDIELKGDRDGFLVQNLKHIRLPAQDSSSALALNWLKYAREQQDYLKLKSQLLHEVPEVFDLNSIWNGNNRNQNAALTVFRHYDSASVVKGMVGEKPKTAWVIGYSLLERIHYLLVAGFDVYGNYGHQLNTRLYMDFLRMEGEFNFLAFLPEHSRITIRDEWYKNANETIKDYLYGSYAYLNTDSRIVYQSSDNKNELFDQIKGHLGGALNTHHEISTSDQNNNDIERQLAELETLKGQGIMHLPQVIFLLVADNGRDYIYSLIHNNAHMNISHLLNEGSRRISDDDTLTVVNGFLGNYPNVFLYVKKDELSSLVATIKALQTEADYIKLLDDFAVRRNDKRFWSIADRLHELYKEVQPIQAGILDFNRMENR